VHDAAPQQSGALRREALQSCALVLRSAVRPVPQVQRNAAPVQPFAVPPLRAVPVRRSAARPLDAVRQLREASRAGRLAAGRPRLE